jgi:hypothetical protein
MVSKVGSRPRARTSATSKPTRIPLSDALSRGLFDGSTRDVHTECVRAMDGREQGVLARSTPGVEQGAGQQTFCSQTDERGLGSANVPRWRRAVDIHRVPVLRSRRHGRSHRRLIVALRACRNNGPRPSGRLRSFQRGPAAGVGPSRNVAPGGRTAGHGCWARRHSHRASKIEAEDRHSSTTSGTTSRRPSSLDSPTMATVRARPAKTKWRIP